MASKRHDEPRPKAAQTQAPPVPSPPRPVPTSQEPIPPPPFAGVRGPAGPGPEPIPPPFTQPFPPRSPVPPTDLETLSLNAQEPGAQDDVDLDVVPDEADAVPVVLVEPDPMLLVAGMTPVYNPFYAPVETQYNGIFYTVRGKGIDLVATPAADMAVGPDNSGGKLSQVGVRRLYAPEPRFAAVAQAEGMSLLDWCAKKNEQVKAEADAACSGYVSAHPELNVAEEPVEDPTP